jgi:ketosteroid isomerase-like protein
MSEENVELVKAVHPPSGSQLTDLFGDETVVERLRATAAFDPKVEVSGGHIAGVSVNARGLDGLIEAWREWLEPWEVYWTEVEDFLDAGNDQVVVLVRDHGRLRASDSEVQTVGGSVWTVRDGKIVRIEFHADREDALEAAGLRE